MKIKLSTAVLLFFMVLSIPAPAISSQVSGWLENVVVNQSISFEAKIDTGADFSSINAVIQRRYHRNGKEWIQFRIENKNGQVKVLEQPVVRYARIKRKQALPVHRPVVLLDICMGNVKRQVEVNLATRGNYKYKMLIGRNFLRGHFLVDSASKFGLKADCSESEPEG